MMTITFPHLNRRRANVLSFLLAASIAPAQTVSSSAYRVLGQVNFRQNSVNMVQGVEFNTPGAIAVDSRNGVKLYVSDTGNSRVLAWADITSYQIGDAPALVLGQPGPQYSGVFGIGIKGFTTPTGLAVDPITGNLYVADTSNHRVLRFLAPFSNPTRVEPDVVYGQANFSTRAAAVTNNGMNQPRAVAFDSAGNLWVADTGNNRVLRFPAAVLNSSAPAADVVLGQTDFVSNHPNGGAASVSASGFDAPSGLAFDTQDNLYVSDFNNTRVLKFAGPFDRSRINAVASTVFGEAAFNSRGTPKPATAGSISGPLGLSVDGAGNVYVAVPIDNRVLVFSPAAALGGNAKTILGQSDPAGTSANAGSAPLASPNSFSAPTDIKLTPNGDALVVDSGNHRVLQFPASSKSASRVWGQTDFTANGPNQIKPGSINYPCKMAIDYSASPFALYISDTANNRILVWKDSARLRSGDPADFVIGQPNMRTGVANVDSPGGANPSATSLSNPLGIAVNPYDGALYVADFGNNRVLRYPRPVNQAGRIVPDAVLGQLDFTSSSSALVTASTLNGPAAVAIGTNGNVFVADSRNNRVVEYPSGAGTGAAALRVYGQPNMSSAARFSQVSAQTLTTPRGIAVDAASNLYVVDSGSNRVLIFPNTASAPAAGMPATFVIGQGSFAAAGNNTFKTPLDVAVDSDGSIYVVDNGNNRVVTYSSLVFLPVAGATPSAVIGQPGLQGISNAPNWDSPDGLATPDALFAPSGIYIDRQDTVYIGDAGNDRVLHFLKALAVVNAATYQPTVPVAVGSLASAFGSGLAAGSASPTDTSWPATLAARQVVVNDEFTAALSYAGPGQINFQVPSTAALGTDRVAVRRADTGELLAGGSMVVSAAGPGIFTSNLSGAGQALAVNQDGTLNGPSRPAPVGSTVTLYGTGQGQVSPAVPDGTPAPLSPLANTVAIPTADGKACLTSQPSMCVAVGSGFGAVQYSGLAPNFIGLWQINVQIPAGSATGNAVQVRVIINGSPSNTVTLAVR